MKKLLLGVMTLALLAGVASCKKQKAPEGQDQTGKEIVDTAANKDVTEAASLADIVAKAEAEGANWSKEEWETQIKAALTVYKPYAAKSDELLKKEGAGELSSETSPEMKELEKEFPDYGKLIRKFTEVAKATENGRMLLDNEDWVDKTMQELGVPRI